MGSGDTWAVAASFSTERTLSFLFLKELILFTGNRGMKAAASKQGGLHGSGWAAQRSAMEFDMQMSQIPPFSVSLVENAHGR